MADFALGERDSLDFVSQLMAAHLIALHNVHNVGLWMVPASQTWHCQRGVK